jgi:hypothetical protein
MEPDSIREGEVVRGPMTRDSGRGLSEPTDRGGGASGLPEGHPKQWVRQLMAGRSLRPSGRSLAWWSVHLNSCFGHRIGLESSVDRAGRRSLSTISLNAVHLSGIGILPMSPRRLWAGCPCHGSHQSEQYCDQPAHLPPRIRWEMCTPRRSPWERASQGATRSRLTPMPFGNSHGTDGPTRFGRGQIGRHSGGAGLIRRVLEGGPAGPGPFSNGQETFEIPVASATCRILPRQSGESAASKAAGDSRSPGGSATQDAPCCSARSWTAAVPCRSSPLPRSWGDPGGLRTQGERSSQHRPACGSAEVQRRLRTARCAKTILRLWKAAHCPERLTRHSRTALRLTPTACDSSECVGTPCGFLTGGEKSGLVRASG